MPVTPDLLSALAELVLAIGAVGTGVWAVYTYRQSRRMKAAQWINDLFTSFYLNDHFEEMRKTVEYRYDEEMRPLIEARLTELDRGRVPLDDRDINLLVQIDDLLNYFEQLGYLEREGHIKARDRDGMFSYWFDVFDRPRFAAIRRYVDTFGFTEVAEHLDPSEAEYLMLYGTVMAGYPDHEALDLPEHLEYVGECSIAGDLYDLGDYPGLIVGERRPGTVHGELYRVTDELVFEALDDHEGYDPRDRSGSLYRRTYRRLEEPAEDAWVYVYNRDVESAPRIDSGSWRRHTADGGEPSGQG